MGLNPRTRRGHAMIGTAINHDAVESVLGKGGMGVVYRARDTRRNRLLKRFVSRSGM